MAFELTATSNDPNCAGDNCPAFQRDPATGDVYIQGYLLTAGQIAETTTAGGALPTNEVRNRIPGAVFDQLVAQHQAR